MFDNPDENPRQQPGRPIDEGAAAPEGNELETAASTDLYDAAESDNPAGTDAVFPAAPRVEGEFTLALDQLVVGADHPRRSYDFETGVGQALFHAALDPAVLAPIVVLPIENVWYVIDGWARVLALRLQHEDDPAVPVRVVRWTGTEKKAVYQRFSQSFLTLGSKPVECARELARMSEVWAVPDMVLAARIGWTRSKVSKHLTAARGERAEPRFAELLLQAANPPIDYLYKVGKALADAGREDADHPRRSPAKGAVATLRKKLEALLGRRERFESKAALVALGIGKAKPEPELPFGAPADGTAGGEPLVLEDVIGQDDVVIGALERHGDGTRRLLLPAEATVAGMTAVEKATARAAYHDAVDRLFG